MRGLAGKEVGFAKESVNVQQVNFARKLPYQGGQAKVRKLNAPALGSLTVGGVKHGVGNPTSFSHKLFLLLRSDAATGWPSAGKEACRVIAQGLVFTRGPNDELVVV